MEQIWKFGFLRMKKDGFFLDKGETLSKSCKLLESYFTSRTKPFQEFATFGKVIFSIFVFSNFSFAQSSDSIYTLIHEIEIESKLIGVDNLNQIYALNPDNELFKYNSNAQEVFRFNNNRLGELSHIDASNPFNVLLFYSEFSNILILDRTLNLNVRLNLFDLNYSQVSAVGLANDNNVWIFDDLNFQLKKIDRKGNVIVTSDNLNFALNKPVRPNFILEKDQKVFVNDPEIGILVFDIFGQFEKVLDFKNLTHFQVFIEQLLYFKDGKLFSFNLKSLLEKPIKLPKSAESTDKILVQKNRMYLIKKERIEVYSF